MSNPQNVILAGGAAAFLAVLLGAFGAHGLKASLSDYEMDVFKTAVQYHMMHALGLLVIGVLMQHYASSYLHYAAWAMLAGIVLFSGSLYVLAVSGVRWLGAITPLGGLCFLVAWLLMVWAVARN